MNDLYILKYNNYYNRILKSETSLANYLNSSYSKVSNVNFNKNDGVTASHVINDTNEFNGDYLIVTGLNSSTIVSRWFILENKWIRQGQYQVSLRRDVLIDYYSQYSTAPVFIEKGALAINDPFIYNSEDMTFNQIKQSETLIKDNYGYPWIVAYLEHDETVHTITYTQNDISYGIDIKADRPQAAGQTYDIVMFPTGGKINYPGGSYTNPTMQKAANLAGQISRSLSSSGILYDIQIVPYFPIDGLIFKWDLADTGILTVTNSNYITLPEGGTISTSQIPPVVYPLMASNTFTASIPYTLSNSAMSYKVDSCCKFIRLCSPNNASNFQYNFAKTKLSGAYSLATLYVHYTLKPFTPYIHIYPQYSSLYNQNFNKDQRGLYVGGDFSMPQLNDSWTAYEINNKSYQDSFDRSIKSMEINQSYQRISQIVNVGTSALGTGASMAAITGPAGGLITGAASLAGGIADYYMSEQLRTEALNYTKDMFGFSLQNIQAMPVTLSKIGSTTYDSKFFPFAEVYSASAQEITALQNKIQYNGMTVGRIGTFADFRTRASADCRYIKCQLIRATGLGDDFHLLKEISDELYKGVYTV